MTIQQNAGSSDYQPYQLEITRDGTTVRATAPSIEETTSLVKDGFNIAGNSKPRLSFAPSSEPTAETPHKIPVQGLG